MTAKKRVLLVDDNADLRYSVVEGMRSIAPEFDFIQADGGEVALSLVKKESFDCVLLDIMMPGIDGWEVAARMKSDDKTKKLPIIFLTAKTDDFSKGMGKITAHDYIEKPFDISDLRKRLRKVVSV